MSSTLKKGFWNGVKRCPKQLLANVLTICLKRPRSRVPVGSLLLEQPACWAAPDKGVNCPHTTSWSQQSFCVSSVTIKTPSSNPTQLFSPCLKKKNTSKLFWCKRGRPAGPGLMATKRPEGLPSFQHDRLWGSQAMGKHYGVSVAEMVNLIKEVTL